MSKRFTGVTPGAERQPANCYRRDPIAFGDMLMKIV